jgi:hypothetical protein
MSVLSLPPPPSGNNFGNDVTVRKIELYTWKKTGKTINNIKAILFTLYINIRDVSKQKLCS